jgi:hypothetical protein
MSHPIFSIGFVTFALTGASVLLYLSSYGLRRIAAWFVRGEPPKDRVLAFALLIAVLFFVVGGFAQAQWDGMQACRDQGIALLDCLMVLR